MADANDGLPMSLDGPAIDVVTAVFALALGEDEVDPDVGFFDLGASSVVVLKVFELLRHRWPDLRVVDFFLHPTGATLAAFLDDGMTS
jgi:Phosphopantetheine attachment site